MGLELADALLCALVGYVVEIIFPRFIALGRKHDVI
jgi:hypothetical protein